MSSGAKHVRLSTHNRRIGRMSSEAKTIAVRRNAKLGGRPPQAVGEYPVLWVGVGIDERGQTRRYVIARAPSGEVLYVKRSSARRDWAVSPVPSELRPIANFPELSAARLSALLVA